jgi:hypothetical protein
MAILHPDIRDVRAKQAQIADELWEFSVDHRGGEGRLRRSSKLGSSG